MSSKANVAATEEGLQGQPKEWESLSLDTCSRDEDTGLLSCISIDPFERHGELEYGGATTREISKDSVGL